MDTAKTNSTYPTKVVSVAFSIKTARSDISASFGECKTIIVLPIIQRKHPSFPNKFNLSLRNLDDKIAATMTERAPRGVTREAEKYK